MGERIAVKPGSTFERTSSQKQQLALQTERSTVGISLFQDTAASECSLHEADSMQSRSQSLEDIGADDTVTQSQHPSQSAQEVAGEAAVSKNQQPSQILEDLAGDSASRQDRQPGRNPLIAADDQQGQATATQDAPSSTASPHAAGVNQPQAEPSGASDMTRFFFFFQS